MLGQRLYFAPSFELIWHSEDRTRCTKCERRLDRGAIQESQRDCSCGIVLEELPSI